MLSRLKRSHLTAWLPGLPPGGAVVFWVVILVASMALLTVYYSVRQSSQSRLQETSQYYLTRLESSLEAALARHSYLARMLAEEASIKAFLQGADGSMSVLQLNEYLERTNSLAGTLDIYLMNAVGTTVASSNWQKPYSFINRNFAFRPYFQQALAGKLGRYYALGTTSSERGYYFASAVQDAQGNPLGVMAVKIDVREVEAQWQREPVGFMVTDRDGILFLASQSAWLFKTVEPLKEKRRQAIRESKRYDSYPLQPLPDFQRIPLGAGYWWAAMQGKEYLVAHREMVAEDWDVYILLDWQTIDRAVHVAMGLALLLLALTGLLLLVLWKYQSQRRRYELAVKGALEIKVEERTRELRLMQEELVQAAKMAALGQLSAAINHELNNPLGAIRAYADNARQFLAMGRTDMTSANLQEISALTERMATITRQLKTFSRKSAGKVETCQLAVALDSALLIIHPKLVQTKVVLHQERLPALQEVQADLVWLEQILVNLLSNAVEAVAEQADGQVWLTTALEHGQACIRVRDNGVGISADDMPHIFEAFFTTKSVGKGLGLGLSISYRLAKDMQGDLTAGNAPQGGAVFTLLLPVLDTGLSD